MAAGILLAMSIVLIASGTLASLWASFGGAFASLQRRWAKTEPTLSLSEQQVQAMRDRFVQMSAENVALRNRLKEYEAIRGEGNVPPQRIAVARANIVARSARQGRRFCEADAGAIDGVEPGMPVLAGWTLVGFIASVQESRCLIQQLTDSESRVPAAVYNGQELLAEGVVAGSGKRAELALNYLEDRQGLEISPGMRVVSSGLDELPPGIGIGLVAAASRSPSSDHWSVQVMPARVMDGLDSVLIVRFGR